MTTTTQSASYSQIHFGGATTSPAPTNCSFAAQHQGSPTQQDSDCGSSSGVGGSATMKREGGCSSDASSVDSDSRDSGAGPPLKPPTVGGTSMPPPPVPGPVLQPMPMFVPQMHPTRHWTPPATTSGLRPPLMVPQGRYLTMTSLGANGYDPATATGVPVTRPGLMSAGPTTVPIVPPTSNGAPAAPVNSPMSNSTGAASGNANQNAFVHLQPGLKIIMNVKDGNREVQGPATIRMVGLSYLTPLPLDVPPGMVLQQLLDENGIKHILVCAQGSPPGTSASQRNNLAPQRNSGATTPLKNTPNAVPSTSNGASPKSVSPPVPMPYPVPLVGQEGEPVYFSNMPRPPCVVKRPSGSGYVQMGCPPVIDPMYGMCAVPPSMIPPQTGPVPFPVVPGSEEVTYDFEEEEHERERLKETLNSIQPPVVTKIYAREVDLSWQAIDTSEAAASGGPFPQIDGSEFVYEIFVADGNNQPFYSQKCDLNTTCVKITRLQPNTLYTVSIRASLPDRDLYGEPSGFATFRTKPIVPETPAPPKISNRGPTWLLVNWRNSVNLNVIRSVVVQIAKSDKRDKDRETPYWTSYECSGADQWRLTNLEIGTSYKIRIIAKNDVGDSDPSPPVYASTIVPNQSHHQHGPSSSQIRPSLPPPIVAFCMNRAVKLAWVPLPGLNPNNYLLEICDPSKTNDFIPVPNDCYNSNGSGAHVQNLQSNREYHFRLRCVTENGQELRSEIAVARTRREQYENSAYQGSNAGSNSGNYHENRDRVLAPVNLQKHFLDERVIEVSWRYPTREFDALSYVLEGAVAEEGQQPIESTWKTCYKGAAPNCTINDPSLTAFRVQAVNNRKHTFSAWSEILYVRRPVQRPKRAEPVISPPAACTTPKFLNVTWCSMDVQWKLTEETETTHPLIYELQRVDTQPIIIYSGGESQCKLENLKPVEHVQVRARAVIVDYEGKRNEGTWSSIGSACTLYNVPSPPQNLRVIQESKKNPVLVWDAPSQTNGSEIIKYVVNAERKDVNKNGEEKTIPEKFGETSKTELELEKLLPACKYSVSVVAVNKGGSSEPSPRHSFESPPMAPDSPKQLHIEALSSTALSLSWTPGNDNGAELTGYRLIIHETVPDSKVKHLIAQHSLAADAEEFVAPNLKPQTLYKLDLIAENSEGSSEPASISCETFAPPPDPPELQLVQAQPSILKLKWTTHPSSSFADPCYFCLEKENDNGSFCRVFDGSARFAKIKGLKEASTHRFRIRAAHAKNVASLTGPWSPVYEFATTRMPPAAIRGAPTVTEVSQCVFQIEWQSVRLINNNNDQENNETVVYRLQVAQKGDRKNGVEQWKTIYEGTCPSYTLTLPPNSTATRVCRVFVVQRSESEELCSSPSLVTSFTTNRTPNESPKKRQKNTGSGSSTPSQSDLQDSPRSPSGLQRFHKMSFSRRMRKFISYLRKTISERNGALVIMFLFFFFSVVIAVILNNYYQL